MKMIWMKRNTNRLCCRTCGTNMRSKLLRPTLRMIRRIQYTRDKSSVKGNPRPCVKSGSRAYLVRLYTQTAHDTGFGNQKERGELEHVALFFSPNNLV
jgi:hypothetical protein